VAIVSILSFKLAFGTKKSNNFSNNWLSNEIIQNRSNSPLSVTVA